MLSDCRVAFQTGSEAADPTTVSTVPDSIAVENPKNFGKGRPYLGRQRNSARRLRNGSYQVPSISCLLEAAFRALYPSHTAALVRSQPDASGE